MYLSAPVKDAMVETTHYYPDYYTWIRKVKREPIESLHVRQHKAKGSGIDFYDQGIERYW